MDIKEAIWLMLNDEEVLIQLTLDKKEELVDMLTRPILTERENRRIR